MWSAHEYSCVRIENSSCRCLLDTFLLETDEFDYLLSLRSLGKDLIIFNFLDFSFLLNVRIKVFEKEVFLINGFNPNLVLIALVIIKFGV